MKIGIHEFERGLMTEWSKKYIAILDANNVPWVKLSINDGAFWEQLNECTHFIYNWGGATSSKQIAHTILPIIEKQLQIKCFPNFATSWHFDDKIKQYFMMKSKDIDVATSYIFFERQPALNWIDSYEDFPIVFKLKSGASSSDVILVKNKAQAIRLINKMFDAGIYPGKIPGNNIFFKDRNLMKISEYYLRRLYRILQKRDANQYWGLEKNYVLFQEFLPDNSYDTRVTIIGKRAFAFRRLNRKNDFRSSGSGLIKYEIDKINMECIRIAFETSLKFNFQSMAYDFLYDSNKEPKICEISYGYNDRAVFNCTGYWDEKLNWHEGHFWPEYLHLINFLDHDKLVCPDF